MTRKGATKGSVAQAKKRPKARRDDHVPAVYQDMLADAEASSSSKLDDDGKTVKKRRVGGRLIASVKDEPEFPPDFSSDVKSIVESDMGSLVEPEQDEEIHPRPLQTMYAESEDPSDSDTAWEEVNLKANVERAAPNEEVGLDGTSIDLVLDAQARSTPKKVMRRKPATAETRKTRLAIHKLHLLCLLSHVHLRNHWCNDGQVQKILRKLLSKEIISSLNPADDESQFQKSRSFMDGLKLASEIFRAKFTPTARGMSSARWAEDEHELSNASLSSLGTKLLPSDIELPIAKSDFREYATKRQGSRDVGAQLFCALLRSAGLDARLVCSLQPLPLASNAAGSIPQNPRRSYIIEEPESGTTTINDEESFDPPSESFVHNASSATYGGDAVRIRSKLATRLGRPPPVSTAPPPVPPEPQKTFHRPIYESPFPIYWVEAFNPAIQKWITIDPLTTKSIAKPSKLYPPASDYSNCLSYVVAFEEDYAARDVTIRYSPAFNAKTRRLRVDITKGGKRWWVRALRCYQRDFELDRDQVEDAELRAKEAQEPMPRSVADFKGHPHFALERHLRRGEVIHPKRKVGKVTVGKSVEIVYRRKDVHVVKSANHWYRLGREIKPGEQPLKRVGSRRPPRALPDDVSDSEDGTSTTLYAPFQTQVCVAPPVVNGRVPKNAFGNLDVYVRSMVPPGAVHIPHPETSHAARILGIDYSDAVTGFEFKGRHGTAIIKGAVIAEEYRDTLITVLQGIEDERRQEEEERRALQALRMWKRILTGLRIRQRIEGYEIEGQRGSGNGNVGHIDDDNHVKAGEGYQSEDAELAGGFVPTSDAGLVVEPTASQYLRHHEAGKTFGLDSTDDYIYGNIDEELQRGKRRNDSASSTPGHQLSHVESLGGGFMIDSDDGEETQYTRGVTKSPQPGTERERMSRDLPESNSLGNDISGHPNLGDDHGSDSPRHLSLSSPHSPPSIHYGLLNRDELEEATILQRLHESGQKNPDASNLRASSHDLKAFQEEIESFSNDKRLENAPGGLAQAAPHFQKSTTAQSQKPSECISPTQANGEIIYTTQNKRTRSSSPESKGSLLSCDPEDDDAEPDWLE